MNSPSTFIRPGTRREQVIAVLMLIAAAVYLAGFVSRGWVPNDEGMIGQSAERVLQGELPHVDYIEPYTGGLAWLYAALFRIIGIDLVNVRWLLFAAASLIQWTVYSVLRRFLTPVFAALGAWVAFAWSFPNYFAGLPSWWILICAILCVWALIRHFETGQLRYVALAGLSVGCAIVIKQTGVYLFMALVPPLLLGDAESRHVHRWFDKWQRPLQVTFGLAAVAFAFVILRSRIFAAEGLFLLVPVAAVTVAGLLPYRDAPQRRWNWSPVLVAVGFACLPFALLLTLYLVRGHVDDFLIGTFVLPQKRLSFASGAMPPAIALLAGVAMALMMLPVPRSLTASEIKILNVVRWVVAILLPIVSLWSEIAYQYVWQSTRSIAALLPVVVLWLVASGRAGDSRQTRIVLALAAMFAWASLNQFPFPHPAYFCYVAPLALLTGIALAGSVPNPRSSGVVQWLVLVLIFAVLGTNRGYVANLGRFHSPRTLNVPLNLDRAHLYVSPNHARTFRRILDLVERHRANGRLVAGPDTPEVYFLAGEFSPSGALYEFLSDDGSKGSTDSDETRWDAGTVIVVNHRPDFSRQLSPTLIGVLRNRFPEGEMVGEYEVRWR